jgi:hypothetical protein
VKRTTRLFILALLASAVAAARAQVARLPQPPQPPPALVSPEVHPDHRVTFRFRDPNAKEILLAREGAKQGSI